MQCNALPSSGPPLAAIDRFLYGYNNVVGNRFEINGLNTGGFSPESGGGEWIEIDERRRVEEELVLELELFEEEEEMYEWGRNYDNEMGLNELMLMRSNNNEVKICSKVKKFKKGSSPTLIKGQWTQEEDRKLIRLVKQHGVRKWAQIAENLDGRAGKQCRERWHNHLRPHIKKESWSEEEERILVETHAKVGNRWAEIAKSIPGRTENSIKNHWNATKRRQISKRKNKRPNSHNGKPHSSILQDYIKTKHNPVATAVASTAASVMASNEPSANFNHFFSECSDSTSNLSPAIISSSTYDDEFLFMQSFFSDSGDLLPPMDDGATDVDYSRSLAEFGSVDSKPMAEKLPKIGNEGDQCGMATSSHLYSDMYLSCLLNGTTSTGSSRVDELETGEFEAIADECRLEDSGEEKREMDLIEMLSFHCYSSVEQKE